MTTLAPEAASGEIRDRRPQSGVRDAYAIELHKLTAQLISRLMLLLVVVGPFAFAAT